MKLTNEQLDELVRVWFEAAVHNSMADAPNDEWMRYRMSEVLEALEKMTNNDGLARPSNR